MSHLTNAAWFLMRWAAENSGHSGPAVPAYSEPCSLTATTTSLRRRSAPPISVTTPCMRHEA